MPSQGAWHRSWLLDIAVHKNWGSHIDASHSRQPLVKGERLVRYEVNAVIWIWRSFCSHVYLARRRFPISHPPNHTPTPHEPGGKRAALGHLGVSGAQREMACCCYSTQASTWYQRARHTLKNSQKNVSLSL